MPISMVTLAEVKLPGDEDILDFVHGEGQKPVPKHSGATKVSHHRPPRKRTA
jgi:hypothetical protein